jgi:acyl-CoA hydrolase
MLYSTSRDGKRSNIVPALNGPAVVVPRGDVHYVVTEYGAVNPVRQKPSGTGAGHDRHRPPGPS